MIPNRKQRDVHASGVAASGAFGISMNDAAHIMTILRDTLYTDKVLAVLREYSSNAWDAHREVGKGDIPIKVTLPTSMNPNLCIQDFGPGLSHEDVFQVYTQYGASTKRENDNAVGMLGIGSKSGFAYSDSFTITSCHQGKRRIYAAVLDESEKGVINLLHEGDCEEHETGVSIQIPIRSEDIREFMDKAQEFFQFFSPRPDINIELPPLPKEATALQHGLITSREEDSERHWIAVMGCVPYRINLDQVRNVDGTEQFWDSLMHVGGCLFFDIGEVRVSASREELKYDTTTKEAIVKKFENLIDEYTAYIIKNIQSTELTPWDKRLQSQILNKLHLPAPKEWREFLKKECEFEKEPTLFSTSTKFFRVSATTRFLIRDDDRPMAGFRLYDSDHTNIVVEKKRVQKDPLDDGSIEIIDPTIEQVRKELDELISLSSMAGIPIEYTSNLTWIAPPPKPGAKKRPVDKKHRARMFRLKEAPNFWKPYSRDWEVDVRTPTPEDVFVVFQSFKVRDGNESFSHCYKQDVELSEVLGLQMPTIYGYKSTERRTIFVGNCVGVHYFDWRKKRIEEILQDPKIQKDLELVRWVSNTNSSPFAYYDLSRHRLKPLIENLGRRHPIVRYFLKIHLATSKFHKMPQDRQHVLAILRTYAKPAPGEATWETELEGFYKKYPLLHTDYASIRVLLEKRRDKDEAKPYYDYIKLIDRYHTEEGDKTNASSELHADERLADDHLEREAGDGAEGSTELHPSEDGDHQ